ncbi:HAD family hydrolase [Guptibacillus hwajinpoensis]|uniref:Cof subfamily protein (Haloacid dehalogenase superfamily) n=1 Tax=Guptibacillus hwajinpoensis TaxID=208199 RepID=A0ABU0K158_9BACL|nr:HAD family hydrolase [Alkalihalobacillus hemicentroti]MDQ0483097.1 Cof subfamily protein (haloacid dehalogenase superfamily) [Alkalihalobacillus hemicentroti]
MVKKPKAIFLDMDGTILNHYNKVSIYTKQIIDEIRKRGIYVFIATGRAMDEINELVPDGFQVDGIISSNGMAGYVGGKAIFEHSLSLELVDKIIKKAREHRVYYELFPYGADRISLKQDRQYIEDEIREPKPESVGLNEWLSRQQAIKEAIEWKDQIEGNKFSKFYFFARTEEHINGWKDELEKIKQVIDFSTSISSSHNVEVMVANMNKSTGIKEMLQYFNLSDVETLAIGDSNNDLPMFQFVDYAVAMKNASDEIKEIVDEVTEYTCDEDGVYHYLKSTISPASKINA